MDFLGKMARKTIPLLPRSVLYSKNKSMGAGVRELTHYQSRVLKRFSKRGKMDSKDFHRIGLKISNWGHTPFTSLGNLEVWVEDFLEGL